MSIKSEMERISNNVSDALAATAEMGASVPEGANSDDLGTLIRSIPQSNTSGSETLKIIATGSSNSSLTQNILTSGNTKRYTAAELAELSSSCTIILQTSVSNKKGYFQYATKHSDSSTGEITKVDFHGYYLESANVWIPAIASVLANASVTITDAKWNKKSVETDDTLKVSGSPADAKIVGDRFTQVNELIGKLEQSSPNYNMIAEVGQTIVVKAVDEDGKPTAWEAADYQPRTHYSEMGMIDVLPETTVEVDPDTGEGFSFTAFELVEGNTYTVVWNGAEYSCVAQDFITPIDEEGNTAKLGLALGNVDLLTGGEGTGEPFAIVSILPEFYGTTNGIPTMVFALDGSTTITVSIKEEGETVHKLDEKYLPDTVPVLEVHEVENVILPETTVEIYPEYGEGVISAEFTLEVGKTYTVGYNGVDYVVSNSVLIDPTTGELAIGNLGAVDESLPTTTEPFILMYTVYTDDSTGDEGNPIMVWTLIPLDGSESVTLSIKGEPEVTRKLNENYMPDSVPHIESHGDVILQGATVEEVITGETSVAAITVPVGTMTKGANYEVRIGNETHQCVAYVVDAEEYNVVLANDANEIIIIVATQVGITRYGYYATLYDGMAHIGETVSISAAYTAHKIDDRCLTPSLFIVSINQEIGGYSPGVLSFDEVYRRYKAGWVPVLRSSGGYIYYLYYGSGRHMKFRGGYDFNEDIDWASDGMTTTTISS